jgi:hypothetical protein
MEVALWAAVKAGECTHVCLGTGPAPTCPAPSAAAAARPGARLPGAPAAPLQARGLPLLALGRGGAAGSGLGASAALGLGGSLYQGGYGRPRRVGQGAGAYGGLYGGSYGGLGGALPRPTTGLGGYPAASGAAGVHDLSMDVAAWAGGSGHAPPLLPLVRDAHARVFRLADFALAPAPLGQRGSARGAQRSAGAAPAASGVPGDGQHVLRVGEPGACSAACGGGEATRPVVCASRGSDVLAPLAACRHNLSALAALATPCNTQMCGLRSADERAHCLAAGTLMTPRASLEPEQLCEGRKLKTRLRTQRLTAPSPRAQLSRVLLAGGAMERLLAALRGRLRTALRRLHARRSGGVARRA